MLGVHRSTVTRELQRNTLPERRYDPLLANLLASGRRFRSPANRNKKGSNGGWGGRQSLYSHFYLRLREGRQQNRSARKISALSFRHPVFGRRKGLKLPYPDRFMLIRKLFTYIWRFDRKDYRLFRKKRLSLKRRRRVVMRLTLSSRAYRQKKRLRLVHQPMMIQPLVTQTLSGIVSKIANRTPHCPVPINRKQETQANLAVCGSISYRYVNGARSQCYLSPTAWQAVALFSGFHKLFLFSRSLKPFFAS